MSETRLPKIYLARHGETEWSLSGRHTGRSDPPLTEFGRSCAAALGVRLAPLKPIRCMTSPSSRAKTTCQIAGFLDQAVVDDDLQEWDYGQYEGLKRARIQQTAPDWQIFRDGAPGGESPAIIAARADRVVQRLRSFNEDVLLFSSGHFLRVLAARWLGRPIDLAGDLLLNTATLSVLGYDHDLTEPAISAWNDEWHLRELLKKRAGSA